MAKVIILVVVLIGLSLAVGAFYVSHNKQNTVTSLTQTSQQAGTTTASNPAQDEAKIRDLLAKNDLQGYKSSQDVIKRLAQKSDVLTIGSQCKITPFIAAFDTTKPTITVKNTDTSARTINFERQVATVSAGQSVQVQISSINDLGFYPFGCDFRPSGGLLIQGK